MTSAEAIIRKEKGTGSKKKRKPGATPHSISDNTQSRFTFRPAYQSSRELIYVLQRIYGLPLQTHTTLIPWGYDQLVELEEFDIEKGCMVTNRYALPNDQAFKLLVQGKYLLNNSSQRKIGKWLGESFIMIGYNFDYVRSYNVATGISEASVNRLYRLYPPEDVCVLPIEERQQAYELRIKSTGCNLQSLKGARPIPGNYSHTSGN